MKSTIEHYQAPQILIVNISTEQAILGSSISLGSSFDSETFGEGFGDEISLD